MWKTYSPQCSVQTPASLLSFLIHPTLPPMPQLQQCLFRTQVSSCLHYLFILTVKPTTQVWCCCVLVTWVSHVKCTAHFKSARFSMVSFAGDVGGLFPRMPMMNGMMGPNTHFPPNPVIPGAGVSGTFSSIHRMPFPENVRWVNSYSE